MGISSGLKMLRLDPHLFSTMNPKRCLLLRENLKNIPTPSLIMSFNEIETSVSALRDAISDSEIIDKSWGYVGRARGIFFFLFTNGVVYYG